MKTRLGQGQTKRFGPETILWIDHEQAVIVGRDATGRDTIETLERESAESEARFEVRIVDELIDDRSLVVTGPEDVRADFDRAYVALTHRPDHLMDVDPSVPAARHHGSA
jgi:hypothetical protein